MVINFILLLTNLGGETAPDDAALFHAGGETGDVADGRQASRVGGGDVELDLIICLQSELIWGPREA